MILKGRRAIFADITRITEDNVLDVIRDALIVHEANRIEIDYLKRFDKGVQPLQRVKTYRPEIDVQDIDNVANEITKFWTGFAWGNPITLVSRGTVDAGNTDENKAIALLNEMYDAIGIRRKTAELAYDVEVTGVGYTFVDIKVGDDETPFSIDVLDPAYTFVIRSSLYADKRVIGGVSYRENNGIKYITVFTDTTRFEIYNEKIVSKRGKETDEWGQRERSNELNPLGSVPIVEWLANTDRMGVFERQIDEMNALNLLASDYCNSVDQNTQAIWHGNDVEFPVDEEGNMVKPKSGAWILTHSNKEGAKPFITPLAISYDYSGMLNNMMQKRALILQKACVPQRNDNSGGSTGIAMSDATGWTNAETQATFKQAIQEDCKMEEIRLVLKAIAKSDALPADSPIRQLKARDIKPNIKRQKTYEMTTKINALATGISHGIDYKQMIKVVNLFDDPQQVASDSEATVKAYLDSIFNKQNEAVGGDGEQKANADRLNQDESDQIDNSKRIDKS